MILDFLIKLNPNLKDSLPDRGNKIHGNGRSNGEGMALKT